MNVFMVLIPHDELITLTRKVATQTPHPVFQAPRAFRAVWHQPERGLDRQFSSLTLGFQMNLTTSSHFSAVNSPG